MNSWSLIIIDLMMDKIDFHFNAIKSWIIHIDYHDIIFFYSLQSHKAKLLIDFHFNAIKSWIIHIDNHDIIFFYSLQSQKEKLLM